MGANPRPTLLRLLRSSRFYLLVSAGVISSTGDWVVLVGLPFYIYITTGSALAVGGMLLAAVLPQIVVGSFAGIFVDRWSRKRTMIAADLLMAVALLPLLLVRSASQVWIVYLVTASVSVVDQFFGPAEGALIPNLIGETDLPRANAIYGSGRQVSRLVGAAAGGVLVGLWGISGISLVDSATFLASAVLLLPIAESVAARSAAVPSAARGALAAVGKVVREWSEGLRAAWDRRMARILLGFCLLVGFGEGVVSTLFAPFIIGALHGNGPEYGWFLGLQAVGGIVGGVLAATYAGDWIPERIFPVTALTFGALDAAVFTYPLFWPTILPGYALIVLVGVPAAFLLAAFTSLQQTAVEDRLRGRFLGAVGTTFSISLVLGILFSGLLADRVGVIPVIELQAAVYLALGFVSWNLFGSPTGTSTVTPSPVVEAD